MTHNDLWPAVAELPRVEKLRLLQLLADDLAQEERAAAIPAEAQLPKGSPLDSYEVAEALVAALKDEQTSKS